MHVLPGQDAEELVLHSGCLGVLNSSLQVYVTLLSEFLISDKQEMGRGKSRNSPFSKTHWICTAFRICLDMLSVQKWGCCRSWLAQP